MGKYYCDYCDMTHDSMNARKAHNTGRNHVANVRDYFANLGTNQAQNMIDQIVHSHEGGGRAQMYAAPSMRLGAGFMNPMATAPGGYPPFQGQQPPPAAAPAAVPPFPPRNPAMPPFPPQGAAPGGPGAPPFPPPGGAMPPFPPQGGARPPFPPRGGYQGGGGQGGQGGGGGYGGDRGDRGGGYGGDRDRGDRGGGYGGDRGDRGGGYRGRGDRDHGREVHPDRMRMMGK